MLCKEIIDDLILCKKDLMQKNVRKYQLCDEKE